MKIFHFNWLLIATCAATHGVAIAGTIEWNSPPTAMNLDSSGAVMDTGFKYELGVFSSGFQPSPSNVADWAANWHKADSVGRSHKVNAFGSSYKIPNNLAPFTVGAKGWILGKKQTPRGTEKILFRNTHWTWPSVDAAGAPASLPREWSVDEKATMDHVVIGSVKPAGSPVLMQSAVVRNYDQWSAIHMAGEDLAYSDDASQGHRVSSILKFALGMDPQDKSQRPSTPVGQMQVGNETFLKMSIPRYGVNMANMRVEVSSDLQTWHNGPAFLEVVTDNQKEWIVRDKTPFSQTGGKRFMRLKVDLPK